MSNSLPSWPPSAPPRPGDLPRPAAKLRCRGLEKRDYTQCGIYPGASYLPIRDAITYLRNRISGHTGSGPGPNNCGRVSCSYRSAVWCCNDQNPVTIQLDGWGPVADAAQTIIDGWLGQLRVVLCPSA
ncbi:hypothetical protein B0T24DRAFT_681268 [Lasiosphaeria ovina]|uniref:Uncharacterized protein n=1 Tax=Lasiosphaeria ovina TaxID=92902 RepID=A0AAE0N3V3_9PEZI|nr:hypothetical protein B0T24DRAFT_681268 [Lasiosphaeria ovina]